MINLAFYIISCTYNRENCPLLLTINKCSAIVTTFYWFEVMWVCVCLHGFLIEIIFNKWFISDLKKIICSKGATCYLSTDAMVGPIRALLSLFCLLRRKQDSVLNKLFIFQNQNFLIGKLSPSELINTCTLSVARLTLNLKYTGNFW